MAEPLEIIAEINALTTHCRPPLMDVEQRSLWQRDWVNDLKKYQLDDIQAVFRQWRQGESQKFPTPGQILPMLERASGRTSSADTPKAWRYDIGDDEYRSLSLHEKIRHHRIAANHCRTKAGSMPFKGKPVRKKDMPKEWQEWRARADFHDEEAKRLQHSIGTLESRA